DPGGAALEAAGGLRNRHGPHRRLVPGQWPLGAAHPRRQLCTAAPRGRSVTCAPGARPSHPPGHPLALRHSRAPRTPALPPIPAPLHSVAPRPPPAPRPPALPLAPPPPVLPTLPVIPPLPAIPAQAGTHPPPRRAPHRCDQWIPACAGITVGACAGMTVGV